MNENTDVIASITEMINSGNFESALAALDSTAPTIKQKAVVLAAVFKQLDMKTFSLLQENQSLNDQLRGYQQLEDQFANDFISGVTSFIVDNNSAFKCQYYYDTSWFAGLEFSNVVKVVLAQQLITAVSKYNVSYVATLWNSIVSGVPSVLDAITFTASKDDNNEE